MTENTATESRQDVVQLTVKMPRRMARQLDQLAEQAGVRASIVAEALLAHAVGQATPATVAFLRTFGALRIWQQAMRDAGHDVSVDVGTGRPRNGGGA